MSLVEEVLGGDCVFCSGPAEEVEAIAATHGRCPGCSRDLDPDAAELDERRWLACAFDDPPTPAARSRPRDPEPRGES